VEPEGVVGQEAAVVVGVVVGETLGAEGVEVLHEEPAEEEVVAGAGRFEVVAGEADQSVCFLYPQLSDQISNRDENLMKSIFVQKVQDNILPRSNGCKHFTRSNFTTVLRGRASTRCTMLIQTHTFEVF